MILREDPEGLIVIAQPAHAAVAGRLAEAWGNSDFSGCVPRHEVCLAAACHDLGWLEWESAPTLNPATGRPHAFDELPSQTHLQIWSTGPRHALALGRYVALLISLHGTNLFELYAPAEEPPSEPVRAYLDAQSAFQADLLDSLRADPVYRLHATPEHVNRNQAIVRVTDALSLYASIGLSHSRRIEGVPTINGPTALLMSPQEDVPGQIKLTPWPFHDSTLRFTLEGRRLPQTFASEDQLRSALDRAPWVAISLEFVPG